MKPEDLEKASRAKKQDSSLRWRANRGPPGHHCSCGAMSRKLRTPRPRTQNCQAPEDRRGAEADAIITQFFTLCCPYPTPSSRWTTSEAGRWRAPTRSSRRCSSTPLQSRRGYSSKSSGGGRGAMASQVGAIMLVQAAGDAMIGRRWSDDGHVQDARGRPALRPRPRKTWGRSALRRRARAPAFGRTMVVAVDRQKLPNSLFVGRRQQRPPGRPEAPPSAPTSQVRRGGAASPRTAAS